ncbi:unannotated protein [freshwater metagenome]|uniref:Unannotated protein n=1 Tax=freshwater metagenome TaxID=449393 RepID=A0A6J6V1E6_9ZZZZ
MGVEVGCTNGLSAALGEFACQCSGERQRSAGARAVTQRLHRLADVLGCGDQLPPQCLREGFEIRRDEVLPQAGNHPAERLGLDLVEHEEREAHRHAAVLVRRVEVVVERKRGLVVGPLGGKLLQCVGLSLQQLVTHQVEQCRVLPAGITPPTFEMAGGGDVVGDVGEVEALDVVVVRNEVEPTDPLRD